MELGGGGGFVSRGKGGEVVSCVQPLCFVTPLEGARQQLTPPGSLSVTKKPPHAAVNTPTRPNTAPSSPPAN